MRSLVCASPAEQDRHCLNKLAHCWFILTIMLIDRVSLTHVYILVANTHAYESIYCGCPNSYFSGQVAHGEAEAEHLLFCSVRIGKKAFSISDYWFTVLF